MRFGRQVAIHHRRRVIFFACVIKHVPAGLRSSSLARQHHTSANRQHNRGHLQERTRSAGLIEVNLGFCLKLGLGCTTKVGLGVVETASLSPPTVLGAICCTLKATSVCFHTVLSERQAYLERGSGFHVASWVGPPLGSAVRHNWIRYWRFVARFTPSRRRQNRS